MYKNSLKSPLLFFTIMTFFIHSSDKTMLIYPSQLTRKKRHHLLHEYLHPYKSFKYTRFTPQNPISKLIPQNSANECIEQNLKGARQLLQLHDTPVCNSAKGHKSSILEKLFLLLSTHKKNYDEPFATFPETLHCMLSAAQKQLNNQEKPFPTLWNHFAQLKNFSYSPEITYHCPYVYLASKISSAKNEDYRALYTSACEAFIFHKIPTITNVLELLIEYRDVKENINNEISPYFQTLIEIWKQHNPPVDTKIKRPRKKRKFS
ncbi:MAG TPA: hypothetical protein VEK38_01195 [Candidatus Bathyarchaeia archaeon]|nr:hypothetical protein [Candidatus Bathyarchaeia archaeon]